MKLVIFHMGAIVVEFAGDPTFDHFDKFAVRIIFFSPKW
jgi:hypothetical protein